LLLASIVLAIVQRTFLQQDRSLRWVAIAVALARPGVRQRAHAGVVDNTFGNATYSYLHGGARSPRHAGRWLFAWFMTLGPISYSVSPMVGVAGIALCWRVR